MPVIGLVQVGMQTMADRFTYVPLDRAFHHCCLGRIANWLRPGVCPDIVPGGGGDRCVLTTCMVLTARQVRYWQDSETLFKRMIAVTKNNYMAHYNLANLYVREKRFGEAEANYEAALDGRTELRRCPQQFRRPAAGRKALRRSHSSNMPTAIRIKPESIYYLNLANALADAASARHDTNEFAAAVRAYGQACSSIPIPATPITISA